MPKKKVGCRTVPAESSKSRPDHPRAPSSDGQAQTQNDTKWHKQEKQRKTMFHQCFMLHIPHILHILHMLHEQELFTCTWQSTTVTRPAINSALNQRPQRFLPFKPSHCEKDKIWEQCVQKLSPSLQCTYRFLPLRGLSLAILTSSKRYRTTPGEQSRRASWLNGSWKLASHEAMAAMAAMALSLRRF